MSEESTSHSRSAATRPGTGPVTEPGTWVAGADGCRGGWCVALVRLSRPAGEPGELRLTVIETFAEVLCLPEAPTMVAVDMPIGLLERAERGGRRCDREARRRLGQRRNSVFSPPVRNALGAAEFRHAQRLNGGGLTLQAFHLIGKIVEMDRLMAPALQNRVREAHPELAFLAMAGHPMAHPKRTLQGRRERLRCVARWLGSVAVEPLALVAHHGHRQVAVDDVLDACAVAHTATLIAHGAARRLPATAPYDAHGLRMEIWY